MMRKKKKRKSLDVNGDGPDDKILVRGVEMLSIRKVARVLGIHPTRAYRLVQERELRIAYRSDRKRYVKASDVVAYRRRRDGWLKLHGRETISASA